MNVLPCYSRRRNLTRRWWRGKLLPSLRCSRRCLQSGWQYREKPGGGTMKSITFLKGSVLVAVPIAVVSVWFHGNFPKVSAAGPARFSGPMSSQPLALNADDTLLAVANPDNNSITLFNVTGGQNVPVTEISVGSEPNGVALSPDGTRAYVANTASGTVTVLSVDRTNPVYGTSVLTTIPVGTEPYGVALTPGGRKLYVANARSNSVSVIDTATNQVIRTISYAGIEPRGIAIT